MRLPTTCKIDCSHCDADPVVVQAHRVQQQPRDTHPPTVAAAHYLALCCDHCQAKGTLSFCSRCKLVRYCTKEHQIAAWPEHKVDCKQLKEAYDEVLEWQKVLMTWALNLAILDEPVLRPRCGAPIGHPDETILGKFSKFGIVPCKYLEARRYFLFRTAHFGTRDSVEQAYDQAMDLLLLDQADKYKARYSVPFLMLLLGKDQTCYDFLKWYITVAPTHDFSNTSLPFLDIQNSNTLESIDYILRSRWRDLDLSVLVAMYLLKFRLVVDCGRMSNLERQKHGKGSSGSATNTNENPDPDNAKQLRLTSSIVATNPLLQNSKTLKPVCYHCGPLFNLIHERNKYFFPLLLEHVGDMLKQEPFEAGSEKEAFYVVMDALYAFSVTDWAFDAVKEQLQEQEDSDDGEDDWETTDEED
ncbi:hypothetical protein HK097_008462 [Rhizophlyctis rosea]|uniref:MYND-type domain-containing protein n=1 Tax=Rhizophlyctis rosea TaxID=64517 RepID=A0AAD5SKG6_9FUNG|nr:hypothetical protein HK097_008462 [Rhizophlyctis rosea]